MDVALLAADNASGDIDEAVGDMLSRAGHDPQLDLLVTVLGNGKAMIEANPGVVEYTGTALVINGQHVGTMCMLHPIANWKGQESAELVKELADGLASKIKAAATSTN